MTIIVCPLSQVTPMIATYTPERIVSLLDPGISFPETGPAYDGRHLRLSFHDAHISKMGLIAPTSQHINELLAFLANWTRQIPILIHCQAGIGRSTATAFITACLHNPQAEELEIAKTLRRISPSARPNIALITLADAALQRNGRMIQAINQTGENLPWLTVSESIPFELPSKF
jgi:predicted protein tyrosine phosphatase